MASQIKFSLTAKVGCIFSMLVVVVIGNFLILSESEKEVNVRHGWVLHTNEVIKETVMLLGYLRDAETGQRGFLLTLDDTYLAPFYKGVSHSYSKFSSIKELTEDNMEQQERLSHIHVLMQEKISELETTIDLAQRERTAEAISIVNSGVGKKIMDSLREQLHVFISAEEDLLRQRNALYFKEKKKLEALFYANVIVLIIFIFVSCIFIQKTIVRPLSDMAKYIVNSRKNLYSSEMNIRTVHDEIGLLISEFTALLREVKDQAKRKDDLISQLQVANNEIKTLQGIIPICSHCKEIRNDEGLWVRLEQYFQDHSDAQFSHSVCDNCLEKYYPEEKDEMDNDS